LSEYVQSGFFIIFHFDGLIYQSLPGIMPAQIYTEGPKCIYLLPGEVEKGI